MKTARSWLASSVAQARSRDELRAAFPDARWLESLDPWYDEAAGDVLLIERSVASTEDIVAPRARFAVVVSGDVSTTGDLILDTGELGDPSLFVVLGTVKARHLVFRRGAVVRVEGSLELSGYCFGDHGTQDGGAWLDVEGDLSALAVLNDRHTDIFVAGALRAPVIAGMVHVGSELLRDDGSAYEDRFVPTVLTKLDDETILDIESASKLALRGESFLRETPPWWRFWERSPLR